MILMLFGVISIYALQENNLVSLHAVSLFVVAIPCYIFIFGLIIYGKHEKKFILSNDKFMIIKEMGYLSLSTLVMIIVYILEFIDLTQLILVIESGQILFCLITSYIQNKWVITKLKQSNERLLKQKLVHNQRKNNKNQIELCMGDILRNKYGFSMFMRHCQSELNVEGLLFIIEVAQYKGT